MRRIVTLVFFLSALFVGYRSQSQVTATGIPGSPFTSLADAITALNGATISSPVVITVNTAFPYTNETSPVAGYIITAQGTATNTITINGNGLIITGNSAVTAGQNSNAIVSFQGADYITFENFVIRNNANTGTGNTPGVTDTRYEFGIALFRSTPGNANGAQHNTIRNNTIDMANGVAAYPSSYGIFSSSAHDIFLSPSQPSATSGTNSYNKFYNNTISGVAHGIVVLASVATTTNPEREEVGVEVGGTAAGTGNTISFAAPASIGTNPNITPGIQTSFTGIQVRNSNNALVSHNEVTMVGSNILAATAILVHNSGLQTLAGTRTVSNNTVEMIFANAFGSSAQVGIDMGFNNINTAGTTVDLLVTQNEVTIEMNAASGATSGAVAGIRAIVQSAARSINNNTVTIGQALAGTATYTNVVDFISIAGSTAATNIEINGNTLSTGDPALYALRTNQTVNGAINIGGTTSGVTGYLESNSNQITIQRSTTSSVSTFGILNRSPVNVPQRVNNNTITITGNPMNVATLDGIRHDGAGNNKTISGNTININAGNTTAAVTTQLSGIYTGAGRSFVLNNNLTVSTGGNTGTGVVAVIRTFSNTANLLATEIKGNTINYTSQALVANQTHHGIFVEGAGHVFQVEDNVIESMQLTTSAVVGSVHNVMGIRFGATTLSAIAGGAGNHIIRGNSITNIETANNSGTAVVEGIVVTGATSASGTADISNNVIAELVNGYQGAASTIRGIRIGGVLPTINLFNNRVALTGNIMPNHVGLDNAVVGIANLSATATSTYNIFHNTVHLNVTGVPATFGSSAMLHTTNTNATTAQINLRNNIFENLSAAGSTAGNSVAIRLSSATLTNYATTSDNNFYYAGAAATNRLIYFDGTNRDQTIAAFKTRMGGTREANSRPTGTPAAVPFLSTNASNSNFLKLDPAVNPEVSNNAVLISGFTTDFEGDVRPLAPATTPDIGADEYAVTCPRPNQPATITLTNSAAAEITVNFAASSPAPTGGYIIVRNTTGITPTVTDGSFTVTGGTLLSTQATNATYVDAGLVNGTTYYYYIFAYDVGGCAGTARWSAVPVSGSLTALVPCATPANPGALTTATPTTASINVSWVAASPVPTGYLVVRSIGAATGLPPVNGTTYTVGAAGFGGVIDYVGTATSFLSSGLTANTTYTYTVYSYNGSCGGAPVYSLLNSTGTGTTTNCLAPGTYSVGPAPSNYTSITQVVGLLTTCGVTGNYFFELKSDYLSTVETFPITIPRFTGSGAGARVVFRPRAGATNLEITSSNATGTINFNGATFVEFDGRVGSTGATRNLGIINTNVGVSPAISFTSSGLGDANNIVLQWLTLRSANNSATSGTITMGTGGFTGFNNINLSNNVIRESPNGTDFPVNGIYANSTNGTRFNEQITISNNNIFNFFSASLDMAGVRAEGFFRNWTISGNNIYQSTNRTISGRFSFLFLTGNNISTENIQVSGNFLGGTSPGVVGANMGISGGTFRGVVLSGSNVGTASGINGNTIGRITFNSSAASTENSLIQVIDGRVDVGTSTGNTLGGLASTSSITVGLTGTGSNFAGILVGTSSGLGGTVNVDNNTLAGFAFSSSTASANFQGIRSFGVTGFHLVRNNIIGDAATPNSISSSANTSLRGISMSIANTALHTVSDNQIVNLTGTGTGTQGIVAGIYTDGTAGYSISNNTIYTLRSASTNATSELVVVGISANSTRVIQTIARNRIYDLVATAPSAPSTVSGIYLASTTSGGNQVLEQNFVHSLGLTTTSTNGFLYGLVVNSGTVLVRNNKVRLGIRADGTAITTGYGMAGILEQAGSASNFYNNSIYIGGSGVGNGNISYAFYSLVPSGARTLLNNIFYNVRSSAAGATSAHYGIRLQSTAGVTSNINNIVANGVNGQFGVVEPTIYATLAAWRAATSLDAISFSAQVPFVNATGNSNAVDLHINPAQASIVEGNAQGTPFATNDYDNDARSTSAIPPNGTDLGADEGTFTAIASPIDVGISAIVLPDATGCYTATQTVSVTIRNYRSTAVAAGVNIPVQVVISGPTNTTLNLTYSGGLAANGTVNFTVGTANMATLGAYVVRAQTNPLGTFDDIDISNDFFQVTRTRVAQAAGTITVTPEISCVTGSVVTATATGSAGGTIQWETSLDNVSWSPVGTPNSLTYVTPSAITQTTFFRVRVSCGGTDLFSNVDTAVLANPTITSSTNATKCGPGLATITAVTPTVGAAVNWFTTAVGGSVVGTGASFSPFVNASATYYASAEIPLVGVNNAAFGTATTVNDASTFSSASYPSPYTNWYGGSKHQMMIRASELTAAGFSAGNITSLSFTMTAIGSTLASNPVLQNFTIGMKSTSNTTLGSTFETGFVTVLPQGNLTLPTTGFPREVTHTFTTPFYWDGVSNIVIQTAYTNGNLGSGTTFVQTRYSDPGFQSTLAYRKDLDANINTFLNEVNPTYIYTNRRPNMRLTISNSCSSSPRVPVTITYTAPPALAITPNTAAVCSGSSATVGVTAGTVGNFTTYTWSSLDGVTLGGTPLGSTITIEPLQASKYVLTATAANGCTNLDSVTVTVLPTPSSITTTPYAICVAATIPPSEGVQGNGTSLVSNIAGSVEVGPSYFRSSGGTTYTNSFTETYYHTFTFTVSATGSYTLNGCATSTYIDMHASLYVNSFNPASPATNFVVANDDGNGANCTLGSRLTATLTAGTTYILVTGTFGDLRTLDFNWTYTGPGSLLSGFLPSAYYWYAAPTGGIPLATGITTFNPVGVAGSGVPNTNTPGTYTFYLAQNNGTCESTRTPVDLVINPTTTLPTALLANGVNPLITCGGTNNVTLTQTGGELGGGASWQWATDPGFASIVGTNTTANAELILTQAPGTSNTYYVRATGATCGPATLASSLTVPVTVNPNGTWIGTNTNWSDPANWCGGIPSNTTNVSVPDYGPSGNYPTVAAATTANLNNLNLATNSHLTIEPTALVNISGTITNNGNLINRGELALVGSGAQNFPGTGTGSVGYLNLLTINKPSGTTTITRSFAVNGALVPTSGTVQIDSVITIRSTNDTTARVGIVGSGASLNYGTGGRFIIERYVPAKRAWRLLTSPTTAATSQSINAAWQEGVTAWPMGPANGTTDPNPGYGTHISGGTQANGYDQNVNGNASIRVFTSGWQNMSVATSLLSKKVTDERAYMLFVRGNRGINMSQGQYAIPTNTTIRSSGRINVANASPFTVTSSGLTLVGNPFPSAISFRQLAINNGFAGVAGRDIFYLWDPTLAGNRNVGAFVTVAYNSGTGNYDRNVTATGVNYTTAGGNQGIDNQGTIQSGLGFFMNFGGTSNTVNFAENIKVAGSTSAVFRPGPQLRTTLRTRMADGSTPINDGVLVNFHPMFSNGADDNDVKKVDNFTENMSLWRDGNLYAIERRKPPVAGDTLHLRLRNLVINNFQFEFAPDSLIYPFLSAFLIDNHLKTETPISLKDTTRYDFTIAANPPSIWAEDRFAIVFKPNVGSGVIPVTITSVRAARRQTEIAVDWTVENEINIRQYVVERSADGRNFSDLGQVAATGRASSAYNWLDQQPLTGDNFYRIRYINADGSVGYSRIVKVDAGKLGRSIVVYPNPITDGIIGTEFRNMPAGIYQARLLSNTGQVLLQKQLVHPGGTALVSLQPDSYLLPGTYQLEIIDAEKVSRVLTVLVK